MKATIDLINKYDWTLVEVIQWLDSNGHSNTDIRKKVDKILNFEKSLKKDSEMELTKISLVSDHE
jgi:outer membrane protease